MSKYFKFNAEHVSSEKAHVLVKQLEDKYDIVNAQMDNTFSNCLIMFVQCTDADAKVIAQAVWEVNGGASCEVSSVTSDELEQYL